MAESVSYRNQSIELLYDRDLHERIKLQDVNLSENNFWSFFQVWNEMLPNDGNLYKNISFRYILNNNFRCIQFTKKWFNTRIIETQRIIVFLKIVFKWSISKRDVLKSKYLIKLLWSYVAVNKWICRKKLFTWIISFISYQFKYYLYGVIFIWKSEYIKSNQIWQLETYCGNSVNKTKFTLFFQCSLLIHLKTLEGKW